MQCPACGSELVHTAIGSNRFDECPACHGAWLDIEPFQKLVHDFERQAAILLRQSGRDAADSPPVSHESMLPCPHCRRPMARYDYAGASGVHVDACRTHGIWFDRDELRRIIQFIQAGGLEERRDRHGSTPSPSPQRAGSAVGDSGVWFWLDLLTDLLFLWP